MVQRIIAHIRIEFTRPLLERIYAQELRRDGIIGACPHVDEAGAGACVLGVIHDASERGTHHLYSTRCV